MLTGPKSVLSPLKIDFMLLYFLRCTCSSLPHPSHLARSLGLTTFFLHSYLFSADLLQEYKTRIKQLEVFIYKVETCWNL